MRNARSAKRILGEFRLRVLARLFCFGILLEAPRHGRNSSLRGLGCRGQLFGCMGMGVWAEVLGLRVSSGSRLS